MVICIEKSLCSSIQDTIATYLKFIYSEKATKLCKISTVDLSYVVHKSQIYGEDFPKFCGLLRIHEIYPNLDGAPLPKSYSKQN